jgi:uncharacterized membrane protein YukC
MAAHDELNNQWHLKKEIQIGQILSVLVMSITGLFYITKMDQRIAIVETQLAAQKDHNGQVEKTLDKLDSKLDRLIERGQPK